MGIALGPHDLLDLAIPSGLDTAELMRFDRERGLSDQNIIAMASQLIGTANQEIVARYAGMIYFTRSANAIYRQGAGERRATPMVGEYVNPDPVRGQRIGHMFSRHDFQDRIELERMFQKRGDMDVLMNSLDVIAESWRNRVDLDIWTRALTKTEILVGTTGYDVPWAIGTGTSNNYVPPQHGATMFDSTHSHFNYFNTSSSETWATLLDAAMLDLREHGYYGTLTTYVSQADAPTIVALGTDKFVQLVQPMLQVTAGGANAPVYSVNGGVAGVPGELIGYYRSPIYGLTEIRYHERIPQHYAFTFQSQGQNNAKNPLAVRIDPEGFGLIPEPQLSPTFTPKVKSVDFFATHGISTNVREAGVASYINAGAVSYVNPTIT